MRYAPIVPLGSEKYLPDAIQGPYGFCFAEHILENLDGPYTVYYKTATSNGGCVIMDTMIYEQGESLDDADLMRAAEYVRPTFMIVPDVMGSYEGTLRNWLHFSSDRQTWERFGRMGVVHGRDLGECTKLAFKMAEDADALALPRVMYDWIGIPRYQFIEHLEREGFFTEHATMQFHLLGASNEGYADVRILAHDPRIMGFDSAEAASAAINGVPIERATPVERKRPNGFFRRPPAAVDIVASLLEHNIKILSDWAADGRSL